jgi:hypothetical protein
VTEFVKLPDGCPEPNTRFNVGDLVRCLIDPLYLSESVFDPVNHAKGIGVVTKLLFFKRTTARTLSDTICEVEIFWLSTSLTSYHLDKYVNKLKIKDI